MYGFKKWPSLDSVLSYFVLRTNDIFELSDDRFISEEKSAGPKGKELAISDLKLFDTSEKPSFFIIRARPGGGRTLTGTGGAFIATGGCICIGGGAFIGAGASITTGAGAFIGAGASITTGAGAFSGAGASIATGF